MTDLTGTLGLARLSLRRDRVRLPVWIVTIGGLVYLQAASIDGLYPTEASLADAAAIVQGNSAFIAMAGPPVALDTVGGRTAFEIASFAMVLAALMSIFQVTRGVRVEEESGRAELLRSGPIGRHAAVAAALLSSALANTAVFAACLVGLVVVGFPAAGSIALALGIALVGVTFAGISSVTNQVAVTGRAASGLAGAALGAAFVLRAVGDVGDGTLSWASPIGWGQALRPYATERWWASGLLVAAVVGCAGTALVLTDHRDLGAGVLHPRTGPARAAPALLREWGLAWRLHRGPLVGWSCGLFLGGFGYGSVGGDVEDFVGESETIADLIAGGGVDLVDGFLATTALVLAVIGSGFGIQAALRPRQEEEAGRLELLLSTGLARSTWLAVHLGVVVTGTALVLGLAGLGTGISFALTADDPGAVVGQVGATLAHLPAATVLIGIAAVLFGLAPRTVGASWGLLAGCFVLDFLGPLLSLPDAVRELSPFRHSPHLPGTTFNPVPVVVLVALAGALGAVGLAAFRRRDVGAT